METARWILPGAGPQDPGAMIPEEVAPTTTFGFDARCVEHESREGKGANICLPLTHYGNRVIEKSFCNGVKSRLSVVAIRESPNDSAMTMIAASTNPSSRSAY